MENFAARSREAFAERFPEIAERLGAEEPQSTIVRERGHPVDIEFGEKRLYAGDAEGFARRQIDAYMAKPLRLYMDRPQAGGLVSPVCISLVDKIKDTLAELQIGEIDLHPVGGPTFLVVYGAGLGHHLAPLVEKTEAKWLVLVEQFPEFISHTFETVDWAKLCEDLESRGGGVHIVCENDPRAMVTQIIRFMTRRGIPYVDGSWVFTHLPLWSYQEARHRLYEGIEYAFVNRGFFEDELIMMTNATANFLAGPFGLIEGKGRLEQKMPAVIVGAGPSLDEAVDTLRAIRDRIVLFSAGTSLRALLNHGIVPDFHCELENVPAVYDVMIATSKLGDLSKITLCSSATIDPRVPSFFKETLYFFRDATSSTMILGKNSRVLSGAAPTCVNTAAALASTFGFTSIILMGTDCGVRPGRRIHAAGTVYNEVGLFKEGAVDPARFPLEVEGNFGGIARTNWVYDACLRMLAEVIRAFNLSAVNCSDGALIPGARPCDPEALEIQGPPVDHAALNEMLRRTLLFYERGEILKAIDLPGVAKDARLLFDDLDALLAELGELDSDFAATYDRLNEFRLKGEHEYSSVGTIVAGTLQALPRIAMFYGFRIADKSLRRKLYDAYIAESRRICGIMREKTLALFERLEGEFAKIT